LKRGEEEEEEADEKVKRFGELKDRDCTWVVTG